MGAGGAGGFRVGYRTASPADFGFRKRGWTTLLLDRPAARTLRCGMLIGTLVRDARLGRTVGTLIWDARLGRTFGMLVWDARLGCSFGTHSWERTVGTHIAAAGWSTLGSYAATHPDEELDVKTYKKLLDGIPATIHQAPNRVRYVMNGFVIATGTYITELTEHAKEIGAAYGKVSVEMGGAACKVPVVGPYLKNVEEKGRLGKKRKGTRC